MLVKHMKWKGAAATGGISGLYALWAFGTGPDGGANLTRLLEWSTAGAGIALAIWASICIVQGYMREESK